jgi:Phage capsid family
MSVTASRDVRARLEQIRSRTKVSREERNRARRLVEAAEAEHDDDALAVARMALEGASEQVELADRLEAEALAQLAGVSRDGYGRGLSERLDEVSGQLAEISRSPGRVGDVRLAEIPREELLGWTGRSLRAQGVVEPTPGMLQRTPERYVPYLTPPETFLDLVPSAATDTPSTPYVKEVPAEGPGPAPGKPGEIKPETAVGYEDATANSMTIAGFLRIKKQALADVPMLDTLIRGRLSQKVRQALERELLSGDGSVSDVPGQPSIIGLLDQPGISHVALGAGDLIPDVILHASTAVMVSGAQPNVVVLSPTDRADMLRTKAGERYVTDPFGAVVSSVWGTSFVAAAALQPGTAIVMDTRLALQLLIRQAAQVLASDADSDSFTRNMVTVLIEGRWALQMLVPAAVCVVDLGGGAGGAQARTRTQTKPRSA